MARPCYSLDHGVPENSLHLSSARADGCGQSLGQLLVNRKSNEITAVPKLLRQLDVKGATVSLDAMGCQKKIAQEIRFADGDYLLALKANHGTQHAEALGYREPLPLGAGHETFGEDGCRVRKGHAAENLALLSKLALNLLRHDRTIKDTVRGKRISSALCEDTLEILMKLNPTK